MNDHERKTRNLFSWVPVALSIALFIWFGLQLYQAQRYFNNERARSQLFYAIFQNNQSAIIVTSRAGRITDWNPAAAEILQWTREEVLGSDLLFLMTDPNLQYRHAELWRHGEAAKELKGRALRVKCWVNRKDAGPIAVDLEVNEVEFVGENLFTIEIIPVDDLIEINSADSGPHGEVWPAATGCLKVEKPDGV